jgi:hypothetical protein
VTGVLGDAIINRSTASARAVFSGTSKLLWGEMMWVLKKSL